MKKTLFLLIFCWPFYALSYESTLHLFKQQFKRAQTPTIKNLALGELWYCSDSLEAAKGHYKYVQQWLPSFIFAKNSLQSLVNRGPIKPLKILYSEALMVAFKNCVDCISGEKYKFKVAKNGDIIYSVSVRRFAEKYPLGSPIKTHQPWALSHYAKCENPNLHNNFNRSSEDRYWTQQNQTNW